jgi:TATA-binding protein-associated factor Taf7
MLLPDQQAGSQSSPAPMGNPSELENQFIMRMPPEPAAALREAIRSGATNLKERLFIKLEPAAPAGGAALTVAEKSSGSHLRRGSVRFDGWQMSAKLMDLPTHIESQKTIDGKMFYKTADICQLLICKEGDEVSDDEPETPVESGKKSKRDPNKVDKKFVYMHGICPPLKNCRRRRFRKTMRKRVLDAPEIEKEVKRLLRVDIEAVDVKYELIAEEDVGPSGMNRSGVLSADNSTTAVDQSDLFGALSDDSDDDVRRPDVDIDSEGDSTMFDVMNPAEGSVEETQPSSQAALVTQFDSSMFPQPTQSSSAAAGGSSSGGSGGAVGARLDAINNVIGQLKTKKKELERNIAHCDNQALLRRFQEALYEVNNELKRKEAEVEDLSMFATS